MSNSIQTLKSLITDRIAKAPASTVWTPVDFIDLGKRDAVDKSLQRLVDTGILQRIDRGLYSRIHINPLTHRVAVPDYQKVIEAVSRRDQVKILIDGMSAANALGLTNTVPGQVIVHTDGRLKPIHIENLTIQFKLTAPSKLYWADHPAVYIIQALYWLQGSLQNFTPMEQEKVKLKLIKLLTDKHRGEIIYHDLQEGLHTLPSWMQEFVKNLILSAEVTIKEGKKNI